MHVIGPPKNVSMFARLVNFKIDHQNRLSITIPRAK